MLKTPGGNADELVARTYIDMPDHVATTERYVLDKKTLSITDARSNQVLWLRGAGQTELEGHGP